MNKESFNQPQLHPTTSHEILNIIKFKIQNLKGKSTKFEIQNLKMK